MPDRPAADRDAQCARILEGVTALLGALSEPMGKQALDIDRTPVSMLRFDLLLRLRDSLAQYADRSVDLYYIGLLGHFSSGKSSTLNSILELSGTVHQRAVDLQPTDKHVTLLAHPTQSRSLLGIVQEGRRVIIRSQEVDRDLLKHVVLADTPGSGDPLLIEEMTKDFLPVCDLILFFFNAASPLDTTDRPLLTEKHKRLPFLPMKFVVTRGDEFRLEPNNPLSSENLDGKRLDGFLKGLVIRVNEFLGTTQYGANDFLVISNAPSAYNIDRLRDLILNFADPSNTERRIQVHGHKVLYFANAANEIRTYFISVLDAKLAGLADLVGRASRNIDKYQNSVSIANNRLTESWVKHLASLGAIRTEARRRSTGGAQVPENVGALIASTTFAPSESMTIATEVKLAASIVVQSVEKTMHVRFGEYLRAVARLVGDAGADLPMSEIGADRVPTAIDPVSIPGLSGRYLLDLAPKYRTAIARTIHGYKGALTVSVDRMSAVLQSAYPLPDYNGIATLARDGLRADLESYFNLVEVYRSGVFSSQARDPIEQLGIGRELGQIEQEFSSESKLLITDQADRRLFPDLDLSMAASSMAMAELRSRAGVLASELGAVALGEPSSSQGAVERAFSAQTASLASWIGRRVSDEVERRCQLLADKLKAVQSEVAALEAREAAQALVARRGFYFRFAVAGLIVGALVIAGWLLFSRPLGSSIGANVALSVAVEIGMGLLALMIARWRDGFPRRLGEIRRSSEQELRNRRSEVIHEVNTSSGSYIRQSESSLVAEVDVAYRKVLKAGVEDEWYTAAESALKSLRDIEARYSGLLSDYQLAVDQAFEKAAAPLKDPEGNLAKLGEVSGEIRARAIQPSFDFLDRAKGDLEGLRARIISIGFS